jgi:hypothetical protein
MEPFLTEFDEPNGDSKKKINYPTGARHAVCSGVYDLGYQKNEFKGNVTVKRQCILAFEFIDEDSTEESNRMTISQKYSSVNLSTNPTYKSKLQKHLESWRDRPFTEQEIKDKFNLNLLYGANCTIVITKNEKGYANISTITKKGRNDGHLIPERKETDVPDWVQKIQAQGVKDGAYESQENQGSEQYTRASYEKEESFADDIPF